LKFCRHILAYLFALAAISTYGQKDTIIVIRKIHSWYSTAGIFGYSDDFYNINGIQHSINISIHQKHFFQARASLGIYLGDGFFGEPTVANRLVSYLDLSILYGRVRYLTSYLMVKACAGISCGKAKYRGKLLYFTNSGWFGSGDSPVFDNDNYNYVGIPLTLGCIVTIPAGGIGLDLYANVRKHPDYGLTLSLNLGSIRDKRSK
jgi:hypothetical protein